MRINKYLAHKGYATRLGADELISAGKVFINGRKAVLGDKVQEKDQVEVKVGATKKSYVYFAYHKPRNVITHSAQKDEEDIRTNTKHDPELKGLFPVGRLDKDSSGLIILTNDGRITDRMLNPEHEHEKEYIVTTKLPLRESFKAKMEQGVEIEGYRTKPAKVKVMGERVFRITLTEGKKHQIRRMVVALFNEVRDLKRVSVLNIKLGSLKEGASRQITGDELKGFLRSLGLS